MIKTIQRFSLALFVLYTTGAGAALPTAIGGQPVTSLAPLVEATSPAVVNIRVRQTLSNNQPYADEAFRRFFGFPDSRGPRQIASAGSGVIVDAANGYILTNHHVVENADEIKVSLLDGQLLDAEVIGSDAATDIALLKVEAEHMVEMPIGDSQAVRVGDFVLAIGNPFGLGHTVTSGIVSALGRSGIGVGLEDFIQTDASINPGNSGGALVNMRGELVGINSAIISRTGGNVGIGFAVPTEIASSVMRQILEYGEVKRGLLGVTISTLDAAAAEALGAHVDKGALITEISPNSAAEKAGLQVEDIIVEVNDKKISDNRELMNVIGLKSPGDSVSIKYVRNGKTRSTNAILGQRIAVTSAGGDIHPGLAGAQFATNTATSGDGVEVTSVDADSPAAQRGLRDGDVIIAVNRVAVNSMADLINVASDQEILFLLVVRGERRLMLQIR
ncbi:MAG TPA: Do family serine endopeptidase [Woeseiaceae bacterium]|nr:Do family serine endopeptidase [Woeseiaceae bacterium]